MNECGPLGRIHYHHDTHARWTDRQLHFWFLTAESVYERETFRRELKKIAQQLQIASYASYELIGAYDLVIRLYLNAAQTKRFRDAINERLSPATQYTFRVEDVARHWVWASKPGDRGPIHVPSDEVLEASFPRSELALLNDQDDNSDERRRLVSEYEALNIVREVVPSDGIKVVITIGFDHEPGEKELATVRDRLCKWLDRSEHKHYERSLYVADSSQKQQFLVICRLAHRDFHNIREWLIEPIGEAVGVMPTHTITYPVASSDFVCFQERMDLPTERSPDVTRLMQSHEQWEFEVKGSLLTPLDPWLKSNGELEEQTSWPLKGVLPEIVGLLNSGGGTMVIGALEERPYERFPQALERLRQFPQVGLYRVVGLVDPTYTELGWDPWHMKLKNLLQSKIDEPPGVLVHAREGELDGQPVCIVEVDEPREDQTFYLKESRDQLVYYGRIGTSCEAMHGRDAERHRENVRQHRRNRQRK